MKAIRQGAIRFGHPPKMEVVGNGEVRVLDDFEKAFRRALENVRPIIEREREAEGPHGPEIMNFVLR